MTKTSDERIQAIIQFLKYAIVGVINTVVTFVVIFITKSVMGINPLVANAIGYVAGLINSFVWNKQWVFHSKKGVGKEAVKFFIGFAVCYGLQLLVVWALTYRTSLGAMTWDLEGFMTVSGYAVATIAGNVVYTLCNFVYNRLITFR